MFLGAVIIGTIFVFLFAHGLKIVANIIALSTFVALVLGILTAFVPTFSELVWQLSGGH